jgi:hypothetical protein
MRRFGLVICALLAVLAGPTVFAQTETPEPEPLPTATATAVGVPVFPITPGTGGVEGTITNDVPAVRYTFDAEAGATIVATMTGTSGDLDPFLLLFDPNGQQLAFNDDFETGRRDARIELAVMSSGAYTIEATRFRQSEGNTTGTYRLTLELTGAPGQSETTDPLSRTPDFGVDFSIVAYQESRSEALGSDATSHYYVVGGQQGDLVRVTMARTSGDFLPQLRIRNRDLTEISLQAQTRDSEIVAYATLPETGWYLIEATRRDNQGSGTYTLFVQGLEGEVLDYGDTVQGELSAVAPTTSFIFNATIGDQVFITLTDPDEEALEAQVSLLDLNYRPVAVSPPTESASSSIRTFIPRSGAYIVQVSGEGAERPFDLTLSGVPVDIGKLLTKPVSYNNRYEGAISDRTPVDYYRFSGKSGELVTLQMNAAGGDLDPYIILADAQLNELAFNDNTRGTPNARIAQFALPADGDYFILATRNQLSRGGTAGAYTLDVSAGAISLVAGAVTVTLEWRSTADLNLFVRDPSGRTVSWSNPQAPSGGLLQIDSNTACETLSDLPVEHIYWPGAAAVEGDYQVWVWYQNVCGRGDPVSFSLVVRVDGAPVLELATGDETLVPGERYEARVRVDEGEGVLLEAGTITSPTPQQTASQGGDIRITYGGSLTGTLNDDVYARFYQFDGRAGDNVIITVQQLTGDLDPVIVLRDADENNLDLNDDVDSSTRNARLAYTLPSDGLYVIAVTRYGAREGTTSGDYRVTLQLDESE